MFTDVLDPLGSNGAALDLTGDDAWLQALVDVELALARAMVTARLSPEWMLGVADSLTALGTAAYSGVATAARGGGNAVIPLVKAMQEHADAEHAGASDFIHLGATSQDIIDSAAMLIAARCLDAVNADLGALGAALSRLADEHRGTVQAGRTLGGHASPTSFGFVAACWLDAVCSVIERVRRVRQALPASLAGAVGTLSVLTEIARERVPGHPDTAVDTLVIAYAEALSLQTPTLSWHSSRLPVVEAGSVFAEATGVVGTIGLAVATLSRTEIGELGEGLAAGEGGSSAMPHKQNPVTSVLLVAAAKQAPGLVSTLYGSLLSDDQRAIGGWHAEWQTLRALERLALSSAAAAVPLVSNLRVDAARMRANLDLTGGLIFSERLSTILAESLGKAVAFELVKTSSAEASSTGRALRDVIAEALEARGEPDDRDAPDTRDAPGSGDAPRSSGSTDTRPSAAVAAADLRARVAAAFDPHGGNDQASGSIDRVRERFAALRSPADQAPSTIDPSGVPR